MGYANFGNDYEEVLSQCVARSKIRADFDCARELSITCKNCEYYYEDPSKFWMCIKKELMNFTLYKIEQGGKYE